MNMKRNLGKFESGISRRQFMKKAAELGVVIAGTSMLPRMSWGSELGLKRTKDFKVTWEVPHGKTFPKNITLGYSSWEPWARQYQLETFGKHTGIKFKTSIYNSGQEMLTKLGGGAAHTYDVFSPSHAELMECVKENWFQPINLDNVPYYKYLHPIFKDNPYVYVDGKHYMVPFVWGTDPVLYNADKMSPEDVSSWSFLYDPKWKGKIAFFENPLTSIGTMAIYLGYQKPFELDEEALQRIKSEFLKIKPNLKTFIRSEAQGEALMASGEIWAVGMARIVMLEPILSQGINCKVAWPKEGSIGWFEGLSISSYTKYKEACEVFADWCVGPEFGTQLARDISYYPCSTACRPNLTPEEIAKVNLDKPEVASKVYMIEWPKNLPRWTEIWAEIKAM